MQFCMTVNALTLDNLKIIQHDSEALCNMQSWPHNDRLTAFDPGQPG